MPLERSNRMRRRRRVKPSGGVQMFSFLDAMICTMGALLVLLHAFGATARTR